MMENPIKMDDLGCHYFWKHPFQDVASAIDFAWPNEANVHCVGHL